MGTLTRRSGPVGKIPLMPGANGYAVVSCHVERPLDDLVWGHYRELIRRRPAGFPIASLMRPPAEGEDGGVFVERAREAAARARSAITSTGPPQRTRVRPRPTLRAPCAREGAWLREQGLEPRFFCGGGWYTDRDVIAAVADLGYADCTATAWRPPYLPPGAARAGLAQPAWIKLDDGRRVLELPTTHSLGAAARSLLAALPPVVHVHFHDYELLDPKRRAAPRGDARPARPPPAAGRSRRPHRRPGGGVGRRLGGLSAALALATLGGCGSGQTAPGLSIRVQRNPFAVSILRDGRTVVAEVPADRLRYQLRSNDRQYALTKVLSSAAGVYQVATSEPGRVATVTVSPTATGARIALTLHPAANVLEVYDAFAALPDEHFVGGGEIGNGERIKTADLRGQIVSIKVGPCSYAPIPFFASSAGWGLRIASENVSALAFPGSTGRHRLPVGPRVALPLPRRSPTGRRSASRGRGSTSASTRGRSRRRSAPTSSTPGCRRCRRARSSS